MEQNKTGKPASRTGRYLKYAIGEIILVMIGILLALQVNNWNESRKQDVTEKEFITGILNDLKQDKAYIELVIKIADKKQNTYKHISNNLSELYKTNRKYLDSLLRIYFVSQRTFYPIFGSYQSAISGNEISKFKNKKFSAFVTKLYNSTYDRILDNGETYDKRWEFLSNKYSYERRTGLIRDMTASQQIEFLDDLSYHMKALDFYVDQLNDALVEISELLNKNIEEI
jgi:hypothetical protein